MLEQQAMRDCDRISGTALWPARAHSRHLARRPSIMTWRRPKGHARNARQPRLERAQEIDDRLPVRDRPEKQVW